MWDVVVHRSVDRWGCGIRRGDASGFWWSFGTGEGTNKKPTSKCAWKNTFTPNAAANADTGPGKRLNFVKKKKCIYTRFKTEKLRLLPLPPHNKPREYNQKAILLRTSPFHFYPTYAHISRVSVLFFYKRFTDVVFFFTRRFSNKSNNCTPLQNVTQFH